MNDYTPDKPSQNQGMGDAGLWRHATATGQFHTSSQKTLDGDLVVKWSDGPTFWAPDQHTTSTASGATA